MAENKKYYWLKLKRDFFKRHDIRIIEEMPNGKDYVLFYLKMLLESIDHNGELRFSDTIPYNEQMLSVITNTNIDIVRSAMKVFVELKMIDVFEDSTIYMNEVQKLLGSETAGAERVRKHRQNQKLLQCNADVTKSNTDIDIDTETDKNKEEELKREKAEEEKEILTEFETLWKMYPRKLGKPKALKSYIKARKNGTTYEQVEQGIKNYLAEIKAQETATEYIKHGSTWFNGECWNDEYNTTVSVKATQQPQQPKQSETDDFMAKLKAMYHAN